MSQASARTNQISDLLANLGLFNGQYNTLREFVKEGNDLLEKEKPVGSSAARIQEQMETCQVGIISHSTICCCFFLFVCCCCYYYLILLLFLFLLGAEH